jgi:DNA processing protein
MPNLNESEKKYYNAVNIVLNGDYRKIKSIKTVSWEESWQKIKKDFPNINPDEEYEKINKVNVKLFLSNDHDFPENLKEIPWPPFAIYIKGDLKPIKSIAIVGTRKAGPQGKSAAKQIAKELAENGLQIISGLAMGIDESSHQGALDAGGATVAVLPSGVNSVYPRQNQNLSERIIENNGALISEFPINYRPYISSFIQRNRIISALSLATIIIEAPEKSGALATARFTLEQNREIFVVPGPAANPNYKGSHNLIRDGAGLVTCAKDILNDLGIEDTSLKKDIIFEKTTSEERLVLEAIDQLGWPVSIDKIAKNCNIQIQKANQIIAFLTIKGILK